MAQDYIEFSEKTLDDAITAACQRFSVTSDRLDYIVVDQGSAGFLGFNARNAVIKAKAKDMTPRTDKVMGDVLENVHESVDAEEVSAAPEAAAAVPAAEETVSEKRPERHSARERDSYKKDRYDRPRRSDRDRSDRSDRRRRDVRDRERELREQEAIREAVALHEAKEKKKAEELKHEYTDEQIEAARNRAEEFLKAMFAAMKLDQVTISSSFDKEENILTLDFDGDEMGVLIGKRGQTLDSIQYLASLIVNKDIEGYIHVKADTENYRERRKKTLENLAKNIASKVKRTRKSVALEPMNPYERRIIHSALQSDHYVTTYSEGEDPYRRVVVTLKK